MPALPRFDTKTNSIQNPHVVILGAGASIATCLNGDKNGKKLPSLQNIQETTGLQDLFKRIELVEGDLGQGFEAKYSKLVNLGKYNSEVEHIKRIIREYFSILELPDQVTIYDLIILGLREKDSIFTFNWDPLLLQAFYRCSGVSTLPKIYFLHGCVDIKVCSVCKIKTNIGTSCPNCGEVMEPNQLLFPVTEKNYESDQAIKSEWDALRNSLSDAYFVTIFGYSAPVTDIAARSVLMDTFMNNQYRQFAEVEIIDIRDRKEIESAWKDFYFSHHYGVYKSFGNSQIFKYFRRSCDAFAMASLQCQPVEENSPNGIASIEKLKKFIKPLVQAEDNAIKFW